MDKGSVMCYEVIFAVLQTKEVPGRQHGHHSLGVCPGDEAAEAGGAYAMILEKRGAGEPSFMSVPCLRAQYVWFPVFLPFESGFHAAQPGPKLT